MTLGSSPLARPHVEFDVLELWVGDLGGAKRVLTGKFGFELAAMELESHPHEKSVCLSCGNVSLILRQGTSTASAIARHVTTHGDGVGDVALVCSDVGAVVDRALAHGLKVSNERGCNRIDVLGDGTILHSIRNRGLVAGMQSPHFHDAPRRGIQMRAIDHITYCLPWGTMERVAQAYREVFGFADLEVEGCDEVGDGASGMRSRVLRSPLGLTIVLTEPMSATSCGQTRHFVHNHSGAGVQHVAIAYDDLITAVESLRSRGVAFLPIPQAHLERSHRRMRDRTLPWEQLQRHQILVDADDDGLLFQLFTRPITDGSGFFVELMHRAGATGFGAANVHALFAAVDRAMREQAVDGAMRKQAKVV